VRPESAGERSAQSGHQRSRRHARRGGLFIETTNVVLPDHRGAPQTGADLPPGDYVALGVTDTGIGMAPHVLAQVFEPFFTTKPFGQGTGLGLSMVYGFAQQSGGQVLLRSAEGQGTTGTIYLRRLLETVESEVPVVVPRDASASTSAVVLVVEDEVNVRMVAVDVLRNSGYTVLEAEDGSCGLNILRSSSRIDLLVSDVGLPGGMNGRQLADAARELRAGLKVLFITGYSEGVVDSTGRLETGMQVLTKPFPMDVFATRVDSMINS
jgi:CheY-like chemotaxis protein